MNDRIPSPERIRVIVNVSGGTVQDVKADRIVDVDVIDHDNWECITRSASVPLAEAHDPECTDHTAQDVARYAELLEEYDELKVSVY